MSKGQTIQEPALFYLHSGVLQRTTVLGDRQRSGPEAGAFVREDEPLDRHVDCGPKATLAIRDPENQYSVWLECRTAPVQQVRLVDEGQILQDIHN